MNSKIFSLFCVLIFVSYLDFGYSMGKMMGGGGGGIVYISDNKPSPLNHPNDMLLITQKGCSPTLIKNSKRKDMLILGECSSPKKKVKKEYIPVPVPVKEYVPVPVMKEKPMMMKMMPMKMEMDMGETDMGYEHMGMMGMDTKKSVTHMLPDSTNSKGEQKEDYSQKSKNNMKIVRKFTKKNQN